MIFKKGWSNSGLGLHLPKARFPLTEKGRSREQKQRSFASASLPVLAPWTACLTLPPSVLTFPPDRTLPFGREGRRSGRRPHPLQVIEKMIHPASKTRALQASAGETAPIDRSNPPGFSLTDYPSPTERSLFSAISMKLDFHNLYGKIQEIVCFL